MRHYLWDSICKQPYSENGRVITLTEAQATRVAQRLNQRDWARYKVLPVDHTAQTLVLGAL